MLSVCVCVFARVLLTYGRYQSLGSWLILRALRQSLQLNLEVTAGGRQTEIDP